MKGLPMSKVHFGGIPTAVDVRKLLQAFGEPTEGTEVTHDDIERVISHRRDSHRYRTVTNAWRQQLRRDHNIEMGAVPGVGFRCLNAEERVSAGINGIQSGARKQLRSIKRVCSVQTDDPVLTKKQELATRYGVALAAEHNAMMKQIEPPKPQQQMPRLARRA
jgi:hypothetical protein